MDWKLINDNVGTREMSATVTLRAAWFSQTISANGAQWHRHANTLPLGIITFAGGYIAGAHVIVDVENKTEGSYPNATLYWRFRWQVNYYTRSAGLGSYYLYGDWHLSYPYPDNFYEEKTFTFSLSGTIKRYAKPTYPGTQNSLTAECVNIDHWNPMAEPLSNIGLDYKDVVESYDFSVPDIDTITGISTDGAPLVDESIIVSGQLSGAFQGGIDKPWIEATYSRSPNGVCTESRNYDTAKTRGGLGAITGAVHVNIGTDEDPVYYWEVTYDTETLIWTKETLGNGEYSLSYYVENPDAWIGLVAFEAGYPAGLLPNSPSITDYAGARTVSYAPDIANMDEVDRSNIVLETPEYHTRLVKTQYESNTLPVEFSIRRRGDVETEDDPGYYTNWSWVDVDEEGAQLERITLDSSTGYSVTYTGKATFFPAAEGIYEEFVDVGPLSRYATIKNVAPTWDEDHYVEGSMHEPAHPPWLPLPVQKVEYDPETGLPVEMYDPETGEPIWDYTEQRGDPWHDNIALLTGSDDDSIAIEDALKITVVPHDSYLPVTPIDFSNEDYAFTNATVGQPNESICVTTVDSPVTADAGDIVSTKTRLNGARFAEVQWCATRPLAEAVLHIGSHAWNLKAVSSEIQHTRIDLCKPDIVGINSDGSMQSVAPYEMPLDKSVWDDVNYEPVRAEESSYDWTYPAGWGVGLVKTLSIECKTPNTMYTFWDVRLKRLSVEEGGFVKLYIFPQPGPWNDSREIDDFAYRESGEINNDSYVDKVSYIPKGFLVVDGAVVWELMAGHVIETHDSHMTDIVVGNRYYDPWYRYYYYRLPRELSDGGIGLPLDDYVTPSAYPINGVATIEPHTGTYTSDDCADVHCLVAFLDGGVYEPDSNYQIIVPLSIKPSVWTQESYACNAQLAGTFKRFRGQVLGLVWDDLGNPDRDAKVTISTVNSSPEAEQTDVVDTTVAGWWMSKALNVKGKVEIEAEHPAAAYEATLRSRHYTRAMPPSSIPRALRYCSADGRIIINTNGTITIDCCQ